jgi:gliding motility-associated-like protein
MRPTRSFITVFFLAAFSGLPAQNISGVINDYSPVTAIGCSYVQVTSPGLFSPGNRVLLIQMQGATVSTGNNISFGSVTSYNDAGHYEFADVVSVSGNTVNFQFEVLNTYTPGATGNVQLIRVPQYTNATVTGMLTCLPWNGTTGGVLVFEVSGTLTMNNDIDVSGRGFRGGTQCTNPDGGCGAGYTDFFYAINSGFGAEKGEGIAVKVPGLDGGRGAWANGGGGGNKHNTGGGGGSNFSAGGQGGNEATFCPAAPVGGTGGYPLTYTWPIFMGGGGGCSDYNNGVGTFGQPGGGIIIVKAGTLAGNNDSILANGQSCGYIQNGIGDGAGGGGAGGTILLDVGNYSSPVIVHAKGGDGGDQNTTYGSCFGPGGGGGVGLAWFSQASLPANVTLATSPGAAGIDLFINSACYLQSHGAQAGAAASGQLFNLVLPEGNVAGQAVNLGNDSAFCSGTVTLNAGNPGSTYLWSTGATTQTITVSAGTYWVSVTSPTGCAGYDTITFTSQALNVSLGADTIVCGGSPFTLSAGNSGASYQWSTGDTSQTITAATSGTYSVLVTDAQGCTGSDVINVGFAPQPLVSLGNDSTYCNGTITLNAGNPGSTYQWSTGSNTQTISVTNGGSYWVTVTNAGGCTDTDTVTFISLLPAVNLGPDTTVCGGNPFTLDAGNNGVSYQWSSGATSTTISVSTSGTYSVLVTNALGCTSSDVINVQFQPAVQVSLGNDIVDCQGNPITLTATGNATNYVWSTGATGSSIVVAAGGQYWVTGNTNGCFDDDTINVIFESFTVNLGPDVITCDTSLVLLAGVTANSYQWSTGETTASITVTTSGTYFLTASSVNCTGTDMVDVLFFDGSNDVISFPNVMTPNGDGVNDYLTPLLPVSNEVTLQVYDRWGNLVYYEFSASPSWNGKSQDGQDVSEGVYYWVAHYLVGCLSQESETKKGFVTILRAQPR